MYVYKYLIRCQSVWPSTKLVCVERRWGVAGVDIDSAPRHHVQAEITFGMTLLIGDI